MPKAKDVREERFAQFIRENIYLSPSWTLWKYYGSYRIVNLYTEEKKLIVPSYMKERLDELISYYNSSIGRDKVRRKKEVIAVISRYVNEEDRKIVFPK